MTYFKDAPVQRTVGLAYEAHDYKQATPMYPGGLYRRTAAGPHNLISALSGDTHMIHPHHTYMTQLRQQHVPGLQGFGDASTDFVNALQSVVGQGASSVAQGFVDAMWPELSLKINEQLKPIEYFMGVTALAAAVAAVFSALEYYKK